MQTTDLDLAAATPVNHLWPALVDRAGLRAATGLPLPESDGLLVLFSRSQLALQLIALQS